MGYDFTVFGASGFTGAQAARYLAKTGAKLCLAGRNRQKLEALGIAGADIAVAEASDNVALGKLAANSKVMVATAGPFAAYGSGVVAACVENKCDYVDITGETVWVRQMIDAHHAQAVKNGVRIVPFCGYDSCPSDLGTLLIVDALGSEKPKRVEGLHRAWGGFNGGTIATLGMFNARISEFMQPYLLSPGYAPTPEQLQRSRDDTRIKKRHGWWTGPFMMGLINTRVVRRSGMLAGYGDAFTYSEYHASRSLLEAHGLRLALAFASTKRGVKLVQRFGPKPGQGPSEKAMNSGWFKSTFFGEGVNGTRISSELSGKGDPGNRITTIFLCESAIAMTETKGPGGVLTPATTFGQKLIARVRDAGITARILPSA